MIRVLLLLCLWVPTALASTSQAPPLIRAAHVPWLEDVPWVEVLQRAGSAAQPILIDFHAPWCGPCRMLDAYVYNEAEVIAELSDVLTYKVDIDKPEYHALKTAFNVTRLPTLIWCLSDGREVDRFTGFVNKVEFLAIVRLFRSGDDSFQRLEQMLGRHPQRPGLLCDLARRSAERGDTQRAEVLYRRLMNLRDADEPQVVVDGMLGLASLQQQAGNLAEARALARRAAQVPGTPGEGTAAGLMAVASFQGTLADTLGMLATYQAIIDLDDMNFQALHGYARTAVSAGVDLTQASRYALRAVVLSDEDPRIISTLSECYFQRHLPAKAKRWLDKALVRDPDNGFYQERAAVFQAAVEKFPAHRRGRRR